MKKEFTDKELMSFGANACNETKDLWSKHVRKRVKINYGRYKDVPKGSFGIYVAKHVEIAMNLILIDGEEMPRAFHIFEFDFVN